MQVALEVWSSDFAQVEATCRLAESLGFDGFYYGESPHGLNLDCWTTLAALAKITDQIRLGPVITNILPTYRSTALLANQASTVAAISGGRLDLRTGVGAARPFAKGWWEPAGVDYPHYEQRLADLTAALELLSVLLIPITVAARGERAMHLAAAHAAVWETSFCTPDEFAAADAAFRRVEAATPHGQTVTRSAEPVRPVIRSLEIDGFVSRSSRSLDRLLARVQSERGAHEDLDPVFERALVGHPSDAAEYLDRLANVGVDQVVVALHDPHDPDALHALADAIALLTPEASNG